MLNDFVEFLKKPYYKEAICKPSLGDFFSLVFLYFLFAVPLGVIAYISTKITGIEILGFNMDFPHKLLLIVFIAPILEETLFRLILVFEKRNLQILTVLIVGFSIYYIISKDFTRGFIFSVIAINLVLANKYFPLCKENFVKYFNYWFFFSTSLFSILHVFNFSGFQHFDFLMSPLFVLPQFFLGLVLGFVRINYGLFYAILYHALINLFGLL